MSSGNKRTRSVNTPPQENAGNSTSRLLNQVALAFDHHSLDQMFPLSMNMNKFLRLMGLRSPPELCEFPDDADSTEKWVTARRKLLHKLLMNYIVDIVSTSKNEQMGSLNMGILREQSLELSRVFISGFLVYLGALPVGFEALIDDDLLMCAAICRVYATQVRQTSLLQSIQRYVSLSDRLAHIYVTSLSFVVQSASVLVKALSTTTLDHHHDADHHHHQDDHHHDDDRLDDDRLDDDRHHHHDVDHHEMDHHHQLEQTLFVESSRRSVGVKAEELGGSTRLSTAVTQLLALVVQRVSSWPSPLLDGRFSLLSLKEASGKAWREAKQGELRVQTRVAGELRPVVGCTPFGWLSLTHLVAFSDVPAFRQFQRGIQMRPRPPLFPREHDLVEAPFPPLDRLAIRTRTKLKFTIASMANVKDTFYWWSLLCAATRMCAIGPWDQPLTWAQVLQLAPPSCRRCLDQADGKIPQQADGKEPQQADGKEPQQADGKEPQQAEGPQQEDDNSRDKTMAGSNAVLLGLESVWTHALTRGQMDPTFALRHVLRVIAAASRERREAATVPATVVEDGTAKASVQGSINVYAVAVLALALRFFGPYALAREYRRLATCYRNALLLTHTAKTGLGFPTTGNNAVGNGAGNAAGNAAAGNGAGNAANGNAAAGSAATGTAAAGSAATGSAATGSAAAGSATVEIYVDDPIQTALVKGAAAVPFRSNRGEPVTEAFRFSMQTFVPDQLVTGYGLGILGALLIEWDVLSLDEVWEILPPGDYVMELVASLHAV
ncbi:hypothetical protein GNI_094980, partial [Gregarina niphandrodes]